MVKINENYLKLNDSYLFSCISKKVLTYQKANPRLELLDLGIGDAVLPLPPVCLEAFRRATMEMGCKSTFRGYGPSQGFKFLREKIAVNDFQSRGIDVSAEEVFVSDGSKCDIANIQELFDINSIVALQDPVYPVYLDTNIIAGRSGSYLGGKHSKVVYLESTEENEFVPDPPDVPVDLIYLCFPNNPTGSIISKRQLEKWVDFAIEKNGLIFYDAAYESFIRDASLPRSIYEIDRAREVAIELRSFSKTAGFTGIRCAYMVVPKNCLAYTDKGNKYSVHELWCRRQSRKFNGVSYPVQRAAEATYSIKGQRQVRDRINYYMDNAAIISRSLREQNLVFTGGTNSPYIWVASHLDSWLLFELLLEKIGIICTPGSGFGNRGSGFARLSSFGTRAKIKLAVDKLSENSNLIPWRERRDSNPRPPA